jgi:uncharacterized membrane protein
MEARAAITVLRPRQEAEELWRDPEYRPQFIESLSASVSFTDAPGDRGTEIHVAFEHKAPGGRLGVTLLKLRGSEPLAKVKDDLRRFKQHAETGEIPRSDALPEGELLEGKLGQRPAQPLRQEEPQEVGSR